MLTNRLNNTQVSRDFDDNASRLSATWPTGASDFTAPATPTSHQPHSPSVTRTDGDINPGLKQDKDMDNHGCDLIVANLSAYQDGELDSAQTRMVALHLGKCPQCGEIFEAIQAADAAIEREWRDDAPLPSSFRFEQAVDNIMAVLPSVSLEPAAFAPRRVHARTRWMRFATGMTGIVALAASLWSSYRLGYANGRRSVASQSLLYQGLPDRSLQMPSAHALLFSTQLRLTPAALFLPPTRSLSALRLHPPSAFAMPAPSTPSLFPRSPAHH